MKPRIAAVIPAAGLSSRMNGFKPLLTIGGKTIIEHVIGLFTGVGISDIITVVGHGAEDLVPVIEATPSCYVKNSNYQKGMFSSIQTGVNALNSTCDAFFLLPVDIPLVQPDTINQLMGAFVKDSSFMVYYPQFQSRHGHPPLINCGLMKQILAYEGEGGMRRFLGNHKKQATVIPVDDPFICMDADTRDDLSFLKDRYRKSVLARR